MSCLLYFPEDLLNAQKNASLSFTESLSFIIASHWRYFLPAQNIDQSILI